jgi:hypothetical protein
MRRHTWFFSALLLASCTPLLGIEEKPYAEGAGGQSGEISGNGGASNPGGAGVGGVAQGGADAGGAGGPQAGGAGVAGAGSGGAAAQGGAAGAGLPGVRPPEPPAQPSQPGSATRQLAFAVRRFHFGQNNPATGMAMTDAWRSIGFDIDGARTTQALAGSSAPGTCLRGAQSTLATLTDGDEGRDNSFASNLFPSINSFGAGKVEGALNQSIEDGSSATMVLLISNLHEGPDDTLVPSSYFFSSAEKPAVPPRWDGTDDFAIDSRAVNQGTLSKPKINFPTGYLKGNTYVSSVFNDASQPHILFIPIGTLGFVGLTFVSLTVVVELDAAHEKAIKATVVGAVAPENLEQIFRNLVVKEFGCDSAKLYESLYNIVYQVCDLRSDLPDFLDKTGTLPCNLISFSLEMDLERVMIPVRLLDGPPPDPPCPDTAGSGGSGGSGGSSGSGGSAGGM